ncbi:NUDIX hydrolase [Sphaerospermopsis aphanizomenoides BCCUSP55]|uniref:NUDIX hydrolase n=1 Tax=Sphaerospermopsis aphanizomenoides TaxID=459663 RepID=UPI000B068151|nr:NUDIX hydrolase [Sphaerospermopsis aphanizomenoides]MBK1988203.1 NUDIX hydrolase [Sphaerospermopsis aphanizomenoides BCCUSP55]
MNNQIEQVAIAILYQDNKFLMQLRDNFPHIAHPGCWGLFGGHLEPGEAPEIALQREILEEIGYELPSFSKFGVYSNVKVLHHVFHAPLLVALDQLVLNEGWDMGFLTPEDIRQGGCYSAIAGEIRPLGDITHQIMLDFISN